MTLSRRSAIKLGLGAGALPLLGRPPFVAEAEAAAPGAAGTAGTSPVTSPVITSRR